MTNELTKLELISAMVMQGIISSGNVVGKDCKEIAEGVAEGAVTYANALLKEIDKQGNGND